MEIDVQKYAALEQKVNRIHQLYDWGFNVPRMIYFPMGKRFNETKLNDFMHKHSHVSIFNIRTYNYNAKTGEEGWSSKHYTGIKSDEIFNILHEIISTTYCMIDAEIPIDGMYAGNIALEDDGFCIVEYCCGRGSMVRNANVCVQGFPSDLKTMFLERKHDGVNDIVDESLKAPRRDILLEWSILANPGGVKGEDMIFWEWRKWIPLEHRL